MAGQARTTTATLKPIQGLMLLDATGVVQLGPDEVVVQRVGLKAWGISCLPREWTLPLLVVDADYANRGLQPDILLSALRSIGVESDADVIVRSSGVKETLRQRGRLASEVCKATDVERSIVKLRSIMQGGGGVVHWLLQSAVDVRSRGHLSNERRLSYEKRDWVAEVEPRPGRRGVTVPIAIRQWRDGAQDPAPTTILCSSEAQVSVCLKTVATWAMRFSDRMHFEWLCDSKKLILAQADREEISGGVDPREANRVEVPVVEVGTLAAFRVAVPSDYASYKKLRNARLYSELGYEMPPFYILADASAVAEILDGRIPDNVRSDLQRLTVRPLIIRTDGLDIPDHKREMLPRSDELRSESEACDWLRRDFPAKIAAGDLTGANIILIAHHFVPAIAAAWARAEPGKPYVRIEALWGVPEGLYWYSHDTFQVNTQSAGLSTNEAYPGTIFPFAKRLRFKGSFVGPDSQGAFVHRSTVPPADWISSVKNDGWLSEIAWTTRRVANEKGQAIALMWFVDTHPGATPHRVLPWFHDSSRIDESPTAAPRNKYRYSSDFRIETQTDWLQLQADLAAGKVIERVVVEPIDPSLVRNPVFAEQLAVVAKKNGIIVELSGGILSHAYYVLTRAGAKVECVDLFGDDADVVEFDKLIRDKIPEGMAERGEIADTIQLTGDALVAALQQKIVEEAFEVLDARSGEEMAAELADVFEVADSLAKALGMKREQIDETRADKLRQRGGFDGGTMLIRTATPGTLNPFDPSGSQNGQLDVKGGSPRVVSDPALLPSKPPYRRPDLRQASDSVLEKVLTVEVDIARLGESLKEVFQFSLPDSNGGEEAFSIWLELKRSGGAVRAVVRLRRGEPQLPLRIE